MSLWAVLWKGALLMSQCLNINDSASVRPTHRHHNGGPPLSQLHCVCLFGILPKKHKLPDVKSVTISIHALDQSANFFFTICLMGCSLEVCSADDVVSQLQWFPFVRPTHRHLFMIDTNAFTASGGGLAENN